MYILLLKKEISHLILSDTLEKLIQIEFCYHILNYPCFLSSKRICRKFSFWTQQFNFLNSILFKEKLLGENPGNSFPEHKVGKLHHSCWAVFCHSYLTTQSHISSWTNGSLGKGWDISTVGSALLLTALFVLNKKSICCYFPKLRGGTNNQS